jgi:hypothetical protein
MVKQYPHYLFIVSGGEATQDEEGNWTDEGEETFTFVSVCREETDGQGTETNDGGGTFHHLSSLIQMPKGVQSIPLGTPVVVSNDAEGKDLRIKGVCLKFDAGQLHSRLWV